MVSATGSTAGPRRSGRFTLSIGIGLGLVLLTMIASALGLLERLERLSFDYRSRWFSFFTPAPTNHVVHINIDDRSLARTRRWPWPRADLARVVDEMHRAGAAVIAFDLLLDEPQEPRHVEVPPWREATDSGETGFTTIHDDDEFAAAIRRAGNVVLAVYATATQEIGPVTRRVVELLTEQPLMEFEALADQLKLDQAQADFIRNSWPSLKTASIRARLMNIVVERGGLPPLEDCRALVLEGLPAHVTASPELTILGREHDAVAAMAHLWRPMPETEDPGPDVRMNTPILTLAEAADASGSVTYESDPDGRVRSVPLWIAHHGKLWPHFALASVCRLLGVPLSDLQISDHATIIPNATLPDGRTTSIRIPMIHERTGDGWTYDDHRLFIPWPTNSRKWENLYDPRKREPVQQFPIGPLVEADGVRRDIADNQRLADNQLADILNDSQLATLFGDEVVRRFNEVHAGLAVVDIDDQEYDALLQRRDAIRQEILGAAEPLLAEIAGYESLTEEEARLRDLLQSRLSRYRELIAVAAAGQAQLAEYESKLRAIVNGAICLVGWTATGAAADFVPTALHAKAPGVIVHGALINAILTNHFIDRGPRWVDLLIVLALGTAVTMIAARVPPVSGLLIVILLAAGYFLFNGLVLFDYGNMDVAAASPLTASVLAWAGVTVFRLVKEQRERARITRQFKNYVSRDLVDLLVENPGQIKTGRHELTCLFADIAGFTTLSERLGPEQTIQLLNRYLHAVTLRIMDRRGYVNKYLGDGIMAFWGAPIDDERHALNCCDSALDCIAALEEVAADPQYSDLPKLFMRVGISTGPMMVGDCGAPPDRSDYTVIGDTVNLASRLESSNKQFGTQILISHRTWELAREQVLARQIGRIQVVGRTEPETVYELLNRHDRATEAQREKAALTDRAVEAYFDCRFGEASQSFEELTAKFGKTKLIELYLAACRRFGEQGAPADFDGSIVLTEK